MTKLSFAGQSDLGKERKNNEDFFLFKEDLFLIADGVAGEDYGEIASKIACEKVSASLKEYLLKNIPPKRAIVDALTEAHKEIIKVSKDKNALNMATTICALLIKNNLAYFTHLGDSRIYHIRGKKIKQLTVDHILGEQNKNGQKSNIITKALGAGKPDIVVQTLALKGKDIFVLTTDGLTDYVSEKDILGGIKESREYTNRERHFCNKMVSLANNRGGKDNITIGMIYVNQISLKKVKKNIIFTTASLFILAALLITGRIVTTPPSNNQSKKNIEIYNFDSFISEWKNAWESMDIERYGKFYSPSFFSSGMNRDEWLDNKKKLNRNKKWISIDIKDIKVEEERSG